MDKDIIGLYLSRNSLDDYNQKKLDDDYEFMLEIADYTRDKRVYYQASEKVKNNIYFVIGIIKIFEKEEDFIYSVCNTYIKKNSSNKDFLILNLYDEFYDKNTNFANDIKKSAQNLYKKYDIDGTFLGVVKKYKKNKKILKFMALKYLENIFYNDSDLTFDGIVHKYIDKDNKQIINCNKFIIKYVRKIDNDLANYLNNCPEIMRNVKVNIQTCIRQWDLYNRKLNNIRVNETTMAIFNYLKDNKNINTDIKSLLCYIIHSLDLTQYFSDFEKANNIGIEKYIDYDNYCDKYNIKKEDIKELEDKVLKIFKKDYIGEKK